MLGALVDKGKKNLFGVRLFPHTKELLSAVLKYSPKPSVSEPLGVLAKIQIPRFNHRPNNWFSGCLLRILSFVNHSPQWNTYVNSLLQYSLRKGLAWNPMGPKIPHNPDR
jgi:hypothetical protein